MCGIIGIISNKAVAGNLINGLKRLEYRGYDSAGIATITNNKIALLKSEGKVKNLEDKYNNEPLGGNIGIAHTRWATHGKPNTINAHPHANEKLALVHNGIIENYSEIKSELIKEGVKFVSDTDTEVILQLITKYLNEGFSELDSVKKSFARFKGAYAVGIIFANHEDLVIGVKKSAPLLIGYGNDEIYLGSDSHALAPFTNKISYLEEGDMVILNRNKAQFIDSNNNIVERPIVTIDNSSGSSEKGNYPHYMLKEIFEQPKILANNLNQYSDNINISNLFKLTNNINKINIIACGTSYYAAMVAKYWFEEFANISVEIDIASEFRYRNLKLNSKDLSIFISQSGETADSLAAMKYAQEQGQFCLSIVNVKESSMARLANEFLEIFAGPEIGVASTKAFTAQLLTLAALVIKFAENKNILPSIEIKNLTSNLKQVPGMINSVLNLEEIIKPIAKEISKAQTILYTGRGVSYAIALEGALKLKELSYIHAEGIAAGELKHGSIALIDEEIFIIAIIPYDRLFEKTLSNLHEISARGGKIIAITDEQGAKELKGFCYKLIILPSSNGFINPILFTIPVQLLAYYAALFRGNDVDQPRNLAKSVTVE